MTKTGLSGQVYIDVWQKQCYRISNRLAKPLPQGMRNMAGFFIMGRFLNVRRLSHDLMGIPTSLTTGMNWGVGK